MSLPLINALGKRNYEVGDRVVIQDDDPYRNKKQKMATVIADCGQFYLTETEGGYRECIFKTQLVGERY